MYYDAPKCASTNLFSSVIIILNTLLFKLYSLQVSKTVNNLIILSILEFKLIMFHFL